MRNIVCTHCNTNVPVPDDLAQGHCVRCGRALALETNITADPPAASRAIQPEAYVERAPGDVRPLEMPERYASWEEFRSLSPAVQKVWMELAMRPLPDLRATGVQTLPADLPKEADAFGEPIASLATPGDIRALVYLLGFVFAGVGSIVGVVIFSEILAKPADGDFWKHFGSGAFYVLAGCGIAYWLLFWRDPNWPVTYWFFQEGIIWQRAGKVHACHWEDVRSMDVHHETGAIGVLFYFADDFTPYLSAKNQPSWMPLLEFAITRVTAAQFIPCLRRIVEGETVQFGVIAISRSEFWTPRFQARWSEISKVVSDPMQLLVDCKNRATWHGVLFSDVSMPHLVLVISHIMIEEHSRLPSVAT